MAGRRSKGAKEDISPTHRRGRSTSPSESSRSRSPRRRRSPSRSTASSSRSPSPPPRHKEREKDSSHRRLHHRRYSSSSSSRSVDSYDRRNKGHGSGGGRTRLSPTYDNDAKDTRADVRKERRYRDRSREPQRPYHRERSRSVERRRHSRDRTERAGLKRRNTSSVSSVDKRRKMADSFGSDHRRLSPTGDKSPTGRAAMPSTFLNTEAEVGTVLD